MIDRKSTILFVGFFLFLVVFDAAQQKYYIDSFNLAEEPVSMVQMLKLHLQRWGIWFLFSLPFSLIVKNQIQLSNLQTWRSKLIVLVSALAGIVASILVISVVNIIQQGIDFSSEVFFEFSKFFVFQKGLTFLMAYGTVALMLINYFRTKEVKAQEVELINLRKESGELHETLESLKITSEPQIGIKIGSKLKPIPLSQIIWIQADDYCVRIHTAQRSYTLRKTLKTLETQLKPFRFVRIHRGALLNLEYVDQINFESSTIKLSNDSELPLSRSGIKTLRKKINESSL